MSNPWDSDPIDKSTAEPWASDPIDAQPGLSPTARAYARTDTPRIGEEVLGGAKHAWDKAAMGLKGIFTDLIPEDKQLLEQGKAFVKETGPASSVGEFVGDVAPVAALPFGAAARVPALAKSMAARGFLPGAARVADVAATQAGIGAALAPEDRGTAAAWGAGGGVLGQTLGRVASGIVKPTAEAQKLISEGVALTPGQAAGKGSAVGTIEEWAATNPVAALAVRPARARASEDMNKVVINQSIEGITGRPVPASLTPRDAYYHAVDLVSKQYDAHLPQISSSTQSVQRAAAKQLAEAANVESLVPRTEWKKAYDYLGGRLLDMERTEGAVLSGRSLKQLDSEIGEHARSLAKSPDPLQRVTSEAWFTVQDGLRDAMQLGAKGDAAEKVAAANLAYKNLIPVRKALGNGDIATPRVLRRTMEHTTHPSKGLVEAANQTLPNTVPSSGTVERAIAMALPAALMGGGGLAQQLGFDMLGGGAIAAGALGTRTGSKLMTGAYPWQRSQMLIDALRKAPVAVTKGDK